MLKQRLLTAAIGVPLLILILVTDKFWLTLGILVVAVFATCEFYSTVGLAKNKFLCTIGCIGAILICWGGNNTTNALSILYVYIATLFVIMLFSNKEITLSDVALVIIGNIYVAFFLSHISLIRRMEYGIYFVWFVFIGAFITDTFAYFVGKSIGRVKLAPNISPKKTIEGAIGGIVGCGLTFILFGYLLINYFNIPVDMLRLFILGLLCAVASEIGDLVASAIKRFYGAKDFGFILPGHGGVLDRFDSILFVAPPVYLFIVYIGVM